METNHLFSEQVTMDLKAEVVAAELIDQNMAELDRTLILMLGASKRSYRKDVDSQELDEELFKHEAYYVIKTHKEGFYDMLPEGLFHQPAPAKNIRTEKEILQYIRQHREEEKNARKFFLPFESAIQQLRVQLALYESRLHKGARHAELVDIFASHWQIFKYLNARQANIFIRILPLLHDIRDDHHVIEKIFELFFEVPVTISLVQQPPIKLNNAGFPTLSECRLGINMTTYCRTLDIGEDELLVEIGPMNSQIFIGFMPGGKAHKILECLCDYLLPVHLDTKIDLKLNKQDKTMKLFTKSQPLNCTLGADTFLGG